MSRILSKEAIALKLTKYVPHEAAQILSEWILSTKCIFKVSKNRSSKLGDYRAPYQGKGHRISVNHNLNPYSFLVTSIHEFAHLKTWEENGHHIKPHGTEWKENYKKLMDIFLKTEIFPHSLKTIIHQHLQNPSASSCSDPRLYKALRAFDQNKEIDQNQCFVEELGYEDHFQTSNGKIFVKLEKIRTRYKCMDFHSKKMYTIPGLAVINPISKTVN